METLRGKEIDLAKTVNRRTHPPPQKQHCTQHIIEEEGDIGAGADEAHSDHHTLRLAVEIAILGKNQNTEQCSAQKTKYHSPIIATETRHIDPTHRPTDYPHETLTQEQARKGRSAYSPYLTSSERNTNTARASLAKESEEKEPQATSEAEPSL